MAPRRRVTLRLWRLVAGRVGPPVVVLAALGVGWHLEADHDRFVLPHPSAVAAQLIDDPGTYLRGAATTLEEALIGLVIGFGAALALAIAMSQLALIRRALLPLAVLANVTPVVAIAPALVVAFGFGATPKIVVTAIICFFPVLVNASAGLRSADPALLEVVETLHASRSEILVRVQLPSSLPFLFTAARICLPLSVIGAVVAELVSQGSTSGLGTVISLAASNSQLDRVYAAVVCLGLIGVALTGLVALAERRVLSWQHPRPRR
jgi:NitT/TauT family transport system permease protein